MIVLFARVPEPGSTKTRLIPCLGAEGAAELAAAMAMDVCEQVLRLGDAAEVALAGNLDHPWVATLPLRSRPQATGDLGQRLEAALVGGGVALGTDAPTLPDTLIREAVAAGDVVFAPAFDGGYTLVGTPDPRGLFDGIPWSDRRTFAASFARARALGYRVRVLPYWYDVDAPEDLDHLRLHLTTLPTDTAPHTRRCLDRLKGTGLLRPLPA